MGKGCHVVISYPPGACSVSEEFMRRGTINESQNQVFYGIVQRVSVGGNRGEEFLRAVMLMFF